MSWEPPPELWEPRDDFDEARAHPVARGQISIEFVRRYSPTRTARNFVRIATPDAARALAESLIRAADEAEQPSPFERGSNS